MVRCINIVPLTTVLYAWLYFLKRWFRLVPDTHVEHFYYKFRSANWCTRVFENICSWNIARRLVNRLVPVACSSLNNKHSQFQLHKTDLSNVTDIARGYLYPDRLDTAMCTPSLSRIWKKPEIWCLHKWLSS